MRLCVCSWRANILINTHKHAQIFTTTTNKQTNKQTNTQTNKQYNPGGRDLLVTEVNVDPIPTGASNPHGNAFSVTETPLLTVGEAAREMAPLRGRTWKVKNPAVVNPITGQPGAFADLEIWSRSRRAVCEDVSLPSVHSKAPASTPLRRPPSIPSNTTSNNTTFNNTTIINNTITVAFKLVPTHSVPMLMQPSSLVARRAHFATKHLWVTRHADDQVGSCWPW